jgi:uncharacterized protein (TIGR03032 family)
MASADHTGFRGVFAQPASRPLRSARPSTTNEPEGWRARKLTGGVNIDVPTGQIISDGLCMPHSPRWHQDRLWALNSGLGEPRTVDPGNALRETVIRLPGYARGLAFHDRLAFVALSTIREKREFGGVPVEQYSCLQCAIHAVDLQNGRSLGAMTFESGCTGIFDLQLLPGRCWPQIVGPLPQRTGGGAAIAFEGNLLMVYCRR